MRLIGLLALAALVGCSSGPEGTARNTCRDAVANKLVGATVSIVGVNQTNDGYLVHTTAMLLEGTKVKVSCWTHADGSLDEIRVSEN